MSGFRQVNANLHILSPIHIGAGVELDPLSYVLREDKLYLIDLYRWVEDHPNAEELTATIETNDFPKIRKYIAESFDPGYEEIILDRIPIISDVIKQQYNDAIYKKGSLQQALINFMTRNEITKTAYIPGSSIKGAIRTAIGNSFVKPAKITTKDGYKKSYDKKIYGNPKEDPMKYLKISDIPLSTNNTGIYEAQEHSLSKKQLTPKGAYEATDNLCMNRKPVVYPLRLMLSDQLKIQNQKIDPAALIHMLHAFYTPKFKEEYRKFYAAADNNTQQEMDLLNLVAATMKTNETLIRIGHFSHVECVSFDDVPQPKTRKGKDGKFLPWGTTRTLADGKYPFGWAKIEIIDESVKSEPRQDTDWPFNAETIRQNMERQEEQKKEIEQARQKAEEKRLAEEKRAAELAAMTPEERLIAEANGPEANDEKLNQLSNRLEDLPEPLKKEAAQLLKEHWQKQNKWVKKDFSTKQWQKWRDKINTIKAILGENC
ncbi:MAG: type III-A CRISPR-associated RAMP protein Csm5 [Thermodesulfobacteriota bacterium]|nr:type III-A CRISPR-associated RAMP protein Csm5 [Thermodesulfobacteriota bacterium]